MKVKLKYEYKGPKTVRVSMESDWLEEKYANILLDDLQKTGRISNIIIMDEMEREWNRKEFSKLQQKIELEPVNPIVYFDGGYDLGTGAAGIGIAIYYEKGKEKFRYRLNAQLDELANNNEAEYAALYNALLSLEEIGVKHQPVMIKGDSQGLIKQLEGEWPCYEENLNKWLDRIELKMAEMGLKETYDVISRTKNKEADQLATQALANKIVKSHIKMSE
jgi:ribonuclease HI